MWWRSLSHAATGQRKACALRRSGSDCRRIGVVRSTLSRTSRSSSIRIRIMNNKERIALILYFILAYAITWTCQIVGMQLATAQGITLSNEDNFLHFLAILSGDARLPYLIFTAGAGPLLAAIIVLAIFEGRSGLRDLFARIGKWQLGMRWYLIVFVLPLALTSVSLLFGFLANGTQMLELNPKLPVAYFLPFLLYMLIFTGLWEEPGWRGFALPRLQ